MSTATEMQEKDAQTKPVGRIVWFEIPANDTARARDFYKRLFGWNINQMPGMAEYWHIDTGGGDEAPDGGLMARKHPQQQITNYVFVESVAESSAQVQALGGKICVPKTAVPQMGYFAVCQDTENNTFGLWEHDPNAK